LPFSRMWIRVITMNTNDWNAFGEPFDSLTAGGEPPDITAIIRAVACEYFPTILQEADSSACGLKDEHAAFDIPLSEFKPFTFPEAAGELFRPLGNAGLPCPASPAVPIPFDVEAVRANFPILREKINGRDLIWLDNAATTQKPRCVIDRLAYFYEHENSNVHRAAHTLAARTTEAYEAARREIAGFLNAGSPDDIIFVRGATEGINLVAGSYGSSVLSPGDEVLVSELEHHANIVPWQMVCRKTGAVLKSIPVDEHGQVDLREYVKLLGTKTKIVALAHVSNVLGTIVPVAEMTALAHGYGAKVLIDGAQAAAHIKTDVQALDCDFYVFSGHKLFGPTGIGALYGKPELLDAMQPYQGGGNMISDVTFHETTYKNPPHKFEAGTGNIADAIALGSAVSYVAQFNREQLFEYEHYLLEYARERLQCIPGLTLLGNAAQRASILSFSVKDKDSDEISRKLDEEGIAVRSGHHCAQPAIRRFGHEGVVRASLAMYNTQEEIDCLACALNQKIHGNPFYFML
jgi:cysteine desulfurase/selenocysteine lyase